MVEALLEGPDFLVILDRANPEEPIAAPLTVSNNRGLRDVLGGADDFSQTIQPIPEIQNHEDNDIALDSWIVGDEEQPSSNLDQNTEQFTRAMAPEEVKTSWTDSEITATVTIQQWYRRRISQRKLERSVFYKLVQDCAQGVTNVDFGHWQAPAHHWQFVAVRRGPLPHVLFVLSSISTLIRSEKATSRRRLCSIGPGDEMERCKDWIAKLGYVLSMNCSKRH